MNKKIERGKETRQQIVATARELFAALGYEGTSIESVLRALGISRGALYHHFASKELLFEAVLDATEAELARAMIKASSGITDPVEALRAGSNAFLEMARDPTVRQNRADRRAGCTGVGEVAGDRFVLRVWADEFVIAARRNCWPPERGTGGFVRPHAAGGQYRSRLRDCARE
jgi:AcrR family transcriptional regulator